MRVEFIKCSLKKSKYAMVLLPKRGYDELSLTQVVVTAVLFLFC